MKTGIIICIAFGLSISFAFAGPGWRVSSCGPGGCPVPAAPERIIQAPAKDRWEADDNEAALFRNGVQIGSWSYTEAYWRDYDARTDTWGPKSLVPRANPPERKQPIAKPIVKVTMLMPTADEFTADVQDDQHLDLTDPKNMGVDMSKIADYQATYSGRKISCERAVELIGKEVPDDSKKFRLVVIGTPSEQKEALAQFAMVEPDIKNRCNTWSVTSDHWSLQDGVTGQAVFKTEGSPVVYFQAPDGKVLHRQDDGKDIPQAIRKAVKAYDSNKDPDLRNPNPLAPTGPINPVVPVGVALGAAALFFYLKGK